MYVLYFRFDCNMIITTDFIFSLCFIKYSLPKMYLYADLKQITKIWKKKQHNSLGYGTYF